MIATLGNFATKLITGKPDRDHPGPRDAAGPRRSAAAGLRVAAAPSGGGAAHARRCVETLREDFATLPALLEQEPPGAEPGAARPRRASRSAAERPGRPARPLRLSASAPRGAGRDRGARGASSPPGCARATSSGRRRARRGQDDLVRGACRALGVSEPVTSPTFTIGQRYAARVAVSHLDLYRLGGLGGEDPGLLDDYLTAGRDRLRRVAGASGRRRALASPRAGRR